mmetsp:Transcript_26359/g.79200  ORF Transcript_26359/g.79200 Transcript_26359/m.79200 type:complete len:896 (-) Transcript_26359:107-2794(-)
MADKEEKPPVDDPKVDDDEETGTEEGSSEEESGSSEYESESDDDDEEPKLKYQRLGACVAEILKDRAATCLAVAGKFLVLGTDWGNIHVLDTISGNECKTFDNHQARINDIAVDKNGDYIASCSDDGKVCIRSLYTNDVQELSFDRPVKAIAIEPDFPRSKKRQFVAGGMAGELVLNEKGWFGNTSKKVLHAGEGPILTIKWRGIFIAWANDLGVKLFDTSTQQRISYIDRPKGSPRPDLYRCRLAWKDDRTLLIGWADSVKVAVVKDNVQPRGQAGSQLPSRYCELTAMFKTDYMVCGLASFDDDLVSVAFVEEDEEAEAAAGGAAVKRRGSVSESMRPELRITSLRNEEMCSDALSIRGFKEYQANDYILESLPEENYFYIVSPKDIVVAKPRDLDDHITWLHSRGQFEEAMQAAEGKEGQLRTHDMLTIRQKFLADLVGQGEYERAASHCPQFLGSDINLWEKWICTFARIKQLRAISHYIPVDHPRLGANVYAMVLNDFLQTDPARFQQTIREWPPTLYDVRKIITAVIEQHGKDPKGHEILMETLGELYTYDKQFDKALHIYLKLKRGDVFNLISKYNLFDSIQDKIVLLMEFDAEKAAELLVNNTQRVSVVDVIAQLESKERYQYVYLEKLSFVDAHAGRDFGTLQVRLTAKYHPERLMALLKQSNYIPLKDAMQICEENRMIPEMVFLLQRVGNIKKALELIITELGDVGEAIDFCKEVNDDELWTELIQRSLTRPDFILGLLNSTGTHINPMRLISMIPTGMRIPGLRGALVKILQDFSLQCELRKGCQTILSQDAVMLHRRLVKAQKRGYRVDPTNNTCPLCNVTEFGNLGVSGRSNRMVSFLCCKKQYCLKCIEADSVGGGGRRADAGPIRCPVCTPKKRRPGKR